MTSKRSVTRLQQSIYDNHHNKIGAICMSHDKVFCASGDVDPRHAQVHVWRVKSLHTLRKISLRNISGCSHLKFTKSEKFLVALGNMRNNLHEFYVEVIDWREETVIDSLLLQNFIVADMFVNKCDAFEFGVCGYGVLRVFR